MAGQCPTWQPGSGGPRSRGPWESLQGHPQRGSSQSLLHSHYPESPGEGGSVQAAARGVPRQESIHAAAVSMESKPAVPSPVPGSYACQPAPGASPLPVIPKFKDKNHLIVPAQQDARNDFKGQGPG